jgi:hypothetical protein
LAFEEWSSQALVVLQHEDRLAVAIPQVVKLLLQREGINL